MGRDIPWASTDMRLRQNSGVSNPHFDSPRGFLEDYGEEKSRRSRSPWLCMWRLRNFSISVPLIASVAIGSSVAAVQFINKGIVDVSSTLTFIVVSIMLIQRGTVRKLGTFRRQHNQLRRQVYFLTQERERLHRTLDRLDETVAELHHIPHELHRITKNQNIEEILAVLERQKEVQDKIRDGLNEKVIQEIFEVLMKQDRDGNWKLKPTEIERVVIRMGLIKEIEFDEKLFRQMLSDDPTVSSVMKIVRSLLERDDEYEYGTSVFKINIV